MTQLDRRDFLWRVARTTGAAALAPSLAGLAACSADEMLGSGTARASLARASKGFGGYGPLTISPDCPELLIPDAFRCVKLSTTFQPSLANPSFRVPAALDGMAAFHVSHNRLRLVRNHEIRDGAGVVAPFGANPYDPAAGGGTTTLEVGLVREQGRVTGVRLLAEFPSITGTIVNCAGGPTPWGSWMTCEETTAGPSAGFEKRHGYVFDVPASANGPVSPVPIAPMGRFVHEALALDPRTGFVYLTEDRSFSPGSSSSVGSGFYRFIPNHPRRMWEGGRLQVLAVAGEPNYNTTRNQTPGQILPVVWVDIDEADPTEAEGDASAVFRQGLEKGAAPFQRLEGCWYGDHSVFFNATSGGNAGEGQVWQFTPRGGRSARDRAVEGSLSLVFESPSASVLESPDNITVSPRGGLVLCEDGGGVQFVRGLTQRGQIFDLVQTNGASTEFAGATFSKDGDVLFFNTQGSTSALGSTPGSTYALFGPWEQGALG